MNCTDAQREMLLAESGELSRARRTHLEAHLAGCTDCRALAGDWQALSRAAVDGLPAAEPSSAVLQRILAAAAERVAARTLVFPAWGVSARILAAAATLFLAVGVAWFASGNSRLARARHMNTLLAELCEDTAPEAGEAGGTRDEMQILARQLLRLQGLVEETSDDAAATMPDEEPSATGPLSHSRAALPATGCV
jgi:hypothetical protein